MKVSEWLTENAASHGIFPAEDLDGLALCDNMRIFQNENVLTVQYKDRVQHHNLRTERQITEAIERRGLGGYFNPGDSRYFWVGWEMASSLSFLIAMKYSTKSGRGFMFRESIQLIQEAGE
jgi:hypothetical protein